MPKKYMTDNTDEKINLRKRFQALRNQLHSAEKDARIREHVSRLAGASFFVYYSVKSEVDTHGILSDLLQRGKCVCLPHIEGRQMIAAPYFGGALPAGMYGIPAPASDKIFCAKSRLFRYLPLIGRGTASGTAAAITTVISPRTRICSASGYAIKDKLSIAFPQSQPTFRFTQSSPRKAYIVYQKLDSVAIR